MFLSSEGKVISVFHPAPGAKLVEAQPVVPEGCKPFAVCDVLPRFVKEIKINGETFSVKAIFMTVRDTIIAVAVTKGACPTLSIDIVDQPWDEGREQSLLRS